MKKKLNLNILVRNMIIIIIFIAIVILICVVPNSGKFSPNVNKSKYRSEKNAEELKQLYEQEENKEKFLSDISKVQNAVSMTLLSDEVVDEKSMEATIKKINKELKKDKWTILNIDVPIFWVGTWNVDSNGSVKFTFLNNKSIPSWAYDEDIKPYIITK